MHTQKSLEYKESLSAAKCLRVNQIIFGKSKCCKNLADKILARKFKYHLDICCVLYFQEVGFHITAVLVFSTFWSTSQTFVLAFQAISGTSKNSITTICFTFSNFFFKSFGFGCAT